MDSYLGRTSDGWSLDSWNKSANQGEKPTDWPDNQSNSVFSFDDRDKSTKRDEGACSSSNDCGSGFGCVGGYCIKIDQRQATNGRNNATSPGSNCEIDPPPGAPNDPCGGAGDGGGTGCRTSGCGGRTGNGDGAQTPQECCGGPIYRRYNAYGSQTQCQPFDPPRGCSKYCTSYWRANGQMAQGCSDNNTCSECSNCITLTGTFGNTGCVGRSDSPCYCAGHECGTAKSGKGACYSCEKEGSDFGKCRLTCKNCVDRCNCFWTCNCGARITQNWTQRSGYCYSGPACSTACRANLASKCDQFCPPPPPNQDPCKDDPNDTCAQTGCYCTTIYRDCGQNPPVAPSDCTVRQLGYISTCGELQTPDPDGILKKAYIWRICCEPPKEEKCLCRNLVSGKQIRSCPECQKCNEKGQCVRNTDCDDECESGVVCDLKCCDPGEVCLNRCSYTVVDACHGAGYTFFGACGGASLSTTATISKEDAVCSRYHTHCRVEVDGKFKGVHLDCQAGVRSNGYTGGFVCGTPGFG